MLKKSWSENSITQIISPVEPPRCQRDAKDAILGSVGPAIIRQISDTHEYQKGQRATQGNNFNQTGAVLHGVYNWIFTYSTYSYIKFWYCEKTTKISPHIFQNYLVKNIEIFFKYLWTSKNIWTLCTVGSMPFLKSNILLLTDFWNNSETLVRRNIHFTGIWCQTFDASSFHTQNIHTSVWTIVCLWVPRKSNWYMEVVSVLDTLTHYSHYGHTLITLACFCLFLTN